jgi:hypothetical protein
MVDIQAANELKNGKRKWGSKGDEMRQFNAGEDANVVSNYSEDVKVKIVSGPVSEHYTVRAYDKDDDRLLNEQLQNVHESRLRVLKGPHFEIRGQVLTTSTVHPNDIGEIVSIGTANSGKKFFKIRFSDKVEEWFGEDQVFVDDEVKRKHEAK